MCRLQIFLIRTEFDWNFARGGDMSQPEGCDWPVGTWNWPNLAFGKSMTWKPTQTQWTHS